MTHFLSEKLSHIAELFRVLSEHENALNGLFMIIAILGLVAFSLYKVTRLMTGRKVNVSLGFLQLGMAVVSVPVLLHLRESGVHSEVPGFAYLCYGSAILASALVNISLPAFHTRSDRLEFEFDWLADVHLKAKKRFKISRFLVVVFGFLHFYHSSIEIVLMEAGVLSMNLKLLSAVLNLGALISLLALMISLLIPISGFNPEASYHGARGEIVNRSWKRALQMR